MFTGNSLVTSKPMVTVTGYMLNGVQCEQCINIMSGVHYGCCTQLNSSLVFSVTSHMEKDVCSES